MRSHYISQYIYKIELHNYLFNDSYAVDTNVSLSIDTQLALRIHYNFFFEVTYCLDLYGSRLWNYSKHDVNQFYVAWRKTIRRLWKIPNTTHCNLLSTRIIIIINSSEPNWRKYVQNLFGPA